MGVNDTAPTPAEIWQQSKARVVFDAADNVDRAGGGRGSSAARTTAARASATRDARAAGPRAEGGKRHRTAIVGFPPRSGDATGD
eukprot:3315834-Prymnesium_polylepis.1